MCAQSGSRDTFDRLASEYDELKLRVIPGYRQVRDLALRYASAHRSQRVLELVERLCAQLRICDDGGRGDLFCQQRTEASDGGKVHSAACDEGLHIRAVQLTLADDRADARSDRQRLVGRRHSPRRPLRDHAPRPSGVRRAPPEGWDRPREDRRVLLDALQQLNQQSYETFGDPETLTRISQYEMAFRMQATAPEAMDISQEPQHVKELYGAEPGRESFANNCLLARRLAERDVRFIQLFDWGWDSHGAEKSEAINAGFKSKCEEMDRPMSALLADLKQRGMLEDTLVIWSGEFGRTSMRENRGGTEMKFVGRDHNPGGFTQFLAGAGIRPGIVHGATDEFGHHAVEKKVSQHDLHATLLHLLGGLDSIVGTIVAALPSRVSGTRIDVLRRFIVSRRGLVQLGPEVLLKKRVVDRRSLERVGCVVCAGETRGDRIRLVFVCA